MCITNLYRRKISTFSVQRRNSGKKKTPTSLYEKKTVRRQWTLLLIFCVDVHMGLDLPPPSTCVHLSLTPPPPCGRYKWMTLYCAPCKYRLLWFSILIHIKICSRPTLKMDHCNAS